jgi:chromosome partitioning protein
VSGDVIGEVRRHFPQLAFRTVVPRNVRLAEAPSYGMPALKLEAKSKGAQAYLALAGEVLRRMEARESAATAATMTTDAAA